MDAFKVFDSILEIDDENGQALKGKAWIKRQQARYFDERAEELDGFQKELHELSGDIEYRLGNPPLRLALFGCLLSLFAIAPPSYSLLARSSGRVSMM